MNKSIIQRKRNAVGTIIGASFFLLIFTSVVSFLFMYMIQVHNINDVYAKSQRMDLDKIRENIEFIDIEKSSTGKLNITVRNNGPLTSKITYIGAINQTSIPKEQIFLESELILAPGETKKDIVAGALDLSNGETKQILVVTELGNIFSCLYPNIFIDNSVGQSSITIIGLGESQHPTYYNLIGNTKNIGGNITDLRLNDDTYFSFESYPSGSSKITQYVDNDDSNIDNSENIGFCTNFVNMQIGPDTNVATFTEEAVGPNNITLINMESFEDVWPPLGWIETPSDNRWNKESDQSSNGSYCADFDGHPVQGFGNLETIELDCTRAIAIYVDFWYRDEGCEAGKFLLEFYDGSNWDTIYDLGSTSSEYQWLHYQIKIIDSQYFITNFKIRWVANGIGNNEHAYVDLVDIKNELNEVFQLDHEVQWNDVPFVYSNEELAIYLASESEEDLSVEVWDGDSWEILLTTLSTGWNNASVSSYLSSSTFTIRFRDVDQYDEMITSWNVDVALLSLWSEIGKHRIDVEFFGIANVTNWSSIFFSLDCSWNVSNIPVSVQLFDFIEDSYATSGDGYITYISNPIPNIEDKINQTILDNPNRFRDLDGNWKVKISAFNIDNPFQLDIDYVEFRPRFHKSVESIKYDILQEYIIKAKTANNEPISFGSIVLYHNGTNLIIRNSVTKEPLTNPMWTNLNKNGELLIEIVSMNPLGEKFSLGTTVGSIVKEKIITQTPQ